MTKCFAPNKNSDEQIDRLVIVKKEMETKELESKRKIEEMIISGTATWHELLLCYLNSPPI